MKGPGAKRGGEEGRQAGRGKIGVSRKGGRGGKVEAKEERGVKQGKEEGREGGKENKGGRK